MYTVRKCDGKCENIEIHGGWNMVHKVLLTLMEGNDSFNGRKANNTWKCSQAERI